MLKRLRRLFTASLGIILMTVSISTLSAVAFSESSGPPIHKSQCAEGGWQYFEEPSFTSQQQCETYVSTHNHWARGNVRFNAYGVGRTAVFVVDNASNKGTYDYRDNLNNSYSVAISDVKVVGNQAWFSGQVTKASNPDWVGQWVFVKVKDNSPDQIWASFTNQWGAYYGVECMQTPADGPFNVTAGAIAIT